MRRPADAGYRGADYDFISALTAEDRRRARSDRLHREFQTCAQRRPSAADAGGAGSKPRADRPPTTPTPMHRSDARCSTCSSPSISSRSWAAARRRCSSSMTAPPPSPGRRSSRPTIGKRTSVKSRGPFARSCCASCGTAAQTIAVTDASADDSILVIGDPACDRSIYPRLMGARREATKVAECLAELDRSVAGSVPVISGPNAGDEEPDAMDVINALMQRALAHRPYRRPWRAADHDREPHEPRGVVLSDGCVSSGRRKSMRCASSPNSCSSIAAISRPTTRTIFSSRSTTIARNSPPAWLMR